NNNNDNIHKRGTVHADLLVAADGPSSSLRRLLLPAASHRTYAGYVAFRGTVPESELSAAAEQVFVEKFHILFILKLLKSSHTLSSGAAGTLEKGSRLVNWVWYCNYKESSEEDEELMTDTDGIKHHFTLPTGEKMRPEVWYRQKDSARRTLPP